MIMYILFPVSIWGPFKVAAQCSASVACRWSNFSRRKQGGEKLLRFALGSVSPAKVSGACSMAGCGWGVVAAGVAGTGLSFPRKGGLGQW